MLEHTNDPANTQEAELIKEQLAKAGIDATLKQDDQTAFIVAAVAGNFSIMLWRQHPGDDPDAQYYWWNTGSTLNFGKFNDPSCRPCSTRAAPRPTPRSASRSTSTSTSASRRRSTTCGPTTPTGWWAPRRPCRGLEGPPLPDGGGKPAVLLYGRQPLLGLYVTK